MKRFMVNKKVLVTVLFLPLLFWSGTLKGQATDTIVKLGGIKIPAYIIKVTSTTIYYSMPEKRNNAIKIERKNVEKAIYRSGKVEIFNNPAFIEIADGDWQAVMITKKKKDIEGLYKRKEISAETMPSAKARKNTIIKMQKQAANAGGTYVLIIKEQNHGIPGEDAGCYMEGIVYGSEPLEEGTDVIKESANK